MLQKTLLVILQKFLNKSVKIWFTFYSANLLKKPSPNISTLLIMDYKLPQQGTQVSL